MSTSDPDYHVPTAEAAYDVARDILIFLLSYASDVIDRETRKAGSDRSVVTEWERRRARWRELRQTMRVDDIETVRTVLDEDGAFMRRIVGGS